MTLQTQKVTVQLLDASGNPVVGATVTAKLDQTDYYTGGTITPVLLSQTTDATGSTVFTLWPNALGTMGSTYHFRAWAPGTNARLLDVFASVPARDCNLQDILNLTPVPVNSWALAVDTNNGIVGKSNGQINFYDAAHTELSYLVNHATAPRTYTFPDRSITVAGLDDIASMQANVAITGGTISGVALTLDNLDNTPVGANTPSTVKATTLTATGLATLQSRTLVNGATDDGGTALQVLGAGKFSDAVTTRSNLGLGSMATQAASAVALTGGSMDGTTIGGTTPAAINGTLGRFNGGVTGPLTGKSLEIGLNGSTGFVQAYDRTNSVALDLVFGATGSLKISAGGRILVNGATDDGSTVLQVAGGGKFSDTLRITSGSYTTPAAGSVFAYGHASAGAVIGGSGSASDFSLMNKNGTVVASIPTGSARLLLGAVTDDGSTTLQVAGTINAQVASGSAQIKYGRTGTTVGGGAFGADANYLFRLYKGDLSASGLFDVTQTGHVLIGTDMDNGADALQVAGVTNTVGVKLGPNTTWVGPGAATGLCGAGGTFGIFLAGQGTSYDVTLFNRSNLTALGVFANSTRVGINNPSDNGSDALQVGGTAIINGNTTAQGALQIGKLGVSGNYATILNPDVAGQNVAWIKNDGVGIHFGFGATPYTAGSNTPCFSFMNGNRLLINTASDNGADALQVAGSIAVGNNGLKFSGCNIQQGGNNVDLYINAASGWIYASSNIVPTADNAKALGQSAARWAAVYAANGTIQTSDRRLKTDFADSLGLDFINQLNPVSYRWRENDNGVHHGLIAQEVDALLDRLGVKSFAGLSKPDEGHMGLNYSEFIAPLIKSVQELSKRVKMLEAVAA